jgi:hypothetical protein
MCKFMLLYVGPETPPNASHEGWPEWFDGIGHRLIDKGSPMAEGLALRADGSTSGAGTRLNGYSVVQAADSDEVVSLAKDHPYLTQGGQHSIEVYSLL